MSDSNTPDCEVILQDMARDATKTKGYGQVSVTPEEVSELAAYVATLKSECDAAQARVKQADIEHEETVKMMRELIAERDNEIACLMALKEQPHD